MRISDWSSDVCSSDLPAVTGAAARGFDDHGFALELLESEDVLVVPGSSFNVPYRNHFRVPLLPQPDDLREVFARIERVLARRPDDAPASRAAVACARTWTTPSTATATRPTTVDMHTVGGR